MKAFSNMAGEQGMDLRDYFAAKALQGMLSNPMTFASLNKIFPEENIDTCYQIADAMMQIREANSV